MRINWEKSVIDKSQTQHRASARDERNAPVKDTAAKVAADKPKAKTKTKKRLHSIIRETLINSIFHHLEPPAQCFPVRSSSALCARSRVLRGFRRKPSSAQHCDPPEALRKR